MIIGIHDAWFYINERSSVVFTDSGVFLAAPAKKTPQKITFWVVST
jgi:hypothetical protein